MSELTHTQIENQAILNFLLGVGSQLNLINKIKKEMEQVWANMRDPQTQNHLIEGIGFSSVKTDAMKDYVERISKVIFNSKGGWQRGFTSKQISEKHELLSASLGKLNTQTLNHLDLFIELMTSLFGYDRRLVLAAIASNRDEEAKQVVLYITTRFDLVAESYDGTLQEDPFEGFYNGDLVQSLSEFAKELNDKMTQQLEQDSFLFLRSLLMTTKRNEL